MRANSFLKGKYSQLKERLTRQLPNDIETYMKGKESLVREIERQAVKCTEETIIVWFPVKSKENEEGLT